MSKELVEAVKLFISQPLNFPLSRGQIMEVARIALPILEQQERDEGEWIDWKGGECPSYCLVEFEMRDGEKHTTLGGMLDWKHESRSDDIIAYRIIPERAANQKGDDA